jgi:MraZ protein
MSPNCADECNFSGSYKCRIDDKGRVILPVKFRNELKRNSAVPDEMIIIFHCGQLRLYSMESWNVIAKSVADVSDPKTRTHLVRGLIGAAVRLCIDQAFRFLIPHKFREQAGLGSKARLTGFPRDEIRPARSYILIAPRD